MQKLIKILSFNKQCLILKNLNFLSLFASNSPSLSFFPQPGSARIEIAQKLFEADFFIRTRSSRLLFNQTNFSLYFILRLPNRTLGKHGLRKYLKKCLGKFRFWRTQWYWFPIWSSPLRTLISFYVIWSPPLVAVLVSRTANCHGILLPSHCQVTAKSLASSLRDQHMRAGCNLNCSIWFALGWWNFLPHSRFKIICYYWLKMSK